MHIKKTFMKHDSNNDNPKHKSIEAPTAGSVSSVMVVIFLVFLFVALRRHTKKREISKSKDRTTKSSSKNRSREGSNSSKGYNYMPLYSSVNNLTKNKLSETIPQSQSITNVGYMDASDFGVQNEDYDHIERDVRREDVDIVYSLTTYQKSEDDYEMSGNFNESLRSYQENYIYD